MYEDLKLRFQVTDITEQREDLTFLTVKKELLVPILGYLRDTQQYTHFAFMAAVDRLEDKLFQLTYMLHSHQKHHSIGVRIFIDRENPVMESIHHLWEVGETYQRELYEMFGINFPGSPGVDENFILEGWQDMPPMRRDFDTKKYSEKTFFPRPGRQTHDPATFMKDKLYDEGEKWGDK